MSSQRRPLRGDRRKSTAPKKKTPAKPPARARRRRKAAPARRRPLILRLLFALFGALARLFWAIGWRVAVIGGLILGGFTLWHASRLPSDPAALVDQRARGSVTLLDRYGRPFAWRGDMFGGMITADTVAPELRDAVIATEDKRFRWHPGIDPIGIAGAIRINLREGRGPLEGHGGSTITQQVAKLMCLGVPYDPEIWETEAAYEAGLPAHDALAQDPGGALRLRDGAALFQGRDPVDLPQPRLSRRRGAGVRGRGAALFRGLRLRPSILRRPRCWRGFWWRRPITRPRAIWIGRSGARRRS
jgi:hypothetical protein